MYMYIHARQHLGNQNKEPHCHHHLTKSSVAVGSVCTLVRIVANDVNFRLTI